MNAAAREPWHTNDYWTGEVNFAQEVRSASKLPSTIQIHDTTLRDGEGTPGVIFGKKEKLDIARALDGLGVRRIEAGEVGISERDTDAIRAVAQAGLSSSVWAWSDGNPVLLAEAISTDVSGVVIGVPCGEPTIRYGGISQREVIHQSVESIQLVKKHGRRAVFFPYDTTRANLSFLKKLVETVAKEAPPESIAIVDTRGVATPQSITYLVKLVRDATGLPIELHCHNDFGLAVANSLAGLAAGAEVIHTCVNGLGERSGNTPLEAVAVALRVLYGRSVGLNLEQLAGLSRLVAGHSGVGVAQNQPVVGEFGFVRVTGAGIGTLQETPTVVFPYRPDLVGRMWEVWLGKVSSRASITYKIQQLGLKAPEDSLDAILALVKESATQAKRCLTDHEFSELVAQAVGVSSRD
jgi:isopropylmalate/homocitrate/citramalate synthase